MARKISMTADDAPSKGDQVPAESRSQPPTLPQVPDPETMDKALKYAVRRGLYAASFLSILYRTFSAIHDFNSNNIDDADFTSTFNPSIFPRMLAPTSVTVTVKGGKVIMSYQASLFPSFPLPAPLKRWIGRYSATASRVTEIESKEQLLALVFTLSLVRNSLVVIGSLPMGLLAGLARSLSATLRSARSVSALIAILIVMFATGDVWKLFGLESVWRCSVLLALTVTIGVLVMTAGLRGWMKKDSWLSVLGYPTDKEDIVLASWVKGTPAERLVAANVKPWLSIGGRMPEDFLEGSTGLVRSFFKELNLQRNVNILLGIAVVADVIAIFFWVSLAFVIVGFIAVSESATMTLTDGPIDVIWHVSLLGQSFEITKQLLLVSMVLGAIAALTFSAASMQDSSSRRTFSEYALTHVRRVVGIYAYYFGGLISLMNAMVADGTLNALKELDIEGMRAIFERLAAQSNDPVPASHPHVE